MAEEKPSNKRKRPFLLNEMISQSSRARTRDSKADQATTDADILQVAQDATHLIKKINEPSPSASPAIEDGNPTVCTTVLTTVSPTLSQSVPHSVPHSVSHPKQQSEQHSHQLSEPQSPPLTPPQSQNIADPFWSLTDRQAKILTYLITNSSRITKHSLISEATSIPYLSVRDALYNLSRDGFLKRKIRFRRGNFQGFKYFLDEEKCEIFMQRQAGQAQPDTEPHSKQQSEQHSASPTVCTTVCTTGTISSSSFLKETTTKELESCLSNHPELGYWRQKGLTAKQVEQWIKITGSTVHNMIQSLCHCRFEMVDLDHEKAKPVKNVFNWFFRVIERVGYYPAPKGYKSYLDTQMEQEKLLWEEREKKLGELRDIQQKKIAQQRELAFREMLNNPEGELYQTCFGRLNHFAKKSSNPELFEMAMRKVFEEVMAKNLQEELATMETKA